VASVPGTQGSLALLGSFINDGGNCLFLFILPC
jgi:hypothetical protein